MKLDRLLKRIEHKAFQGALDLDITDIAYDSRSAIPGALFVCLTGAVVDGHDYIDAAIDKGATAILVSREVPMVDGVTYIFTSDTRLALAELSCEFFGNPSQEINVIGITGTKGKTTVSYMIKRLFEHSGHKVGLIGTIQTIIGDKHEKAKNTTPESYELQKLLRQMVDAGCDFAVLEVSSQGLKMHRVTGTRFPLGIYTNLSRDHIGENEHADMAEYTACKSLFFRMCDTALVNADCPHWREVLQGATCKTVFFGTGDDADIRAANVADTRLGERLCVAFTLSSGAFSGTISAGMPGRHTVYNALASLGAAAFFGVSYADLQTALVDVTVPGRSQLAATGLPFTVLIDYAHNEISMESLLVTLRAYNPNRLLCLFGCGGNRDKSRRYAMGEMAGRYADLAILAEDNPRDEDPRDIIDDIIFGMDGRGKYEIVVDRQEAIFHMLDIAQPGDICAIIGKGHEDYQEIRGKKYPFVEADVVARWVGERG